MKHEGSQRESRTRSEKPYVRETQVLTGCAPECGLCPTLADMCAMAHLVAVADVCRPIGWDCS